MLAGADDDLLIVATGAKDSRLWHAGGTAVPGLPLDHASEGASAGKRCARNSVFTFPRVQKRAHP